MGAGEILLLFPEHCFERENSVKSAPNSVSSAKNPVSSLWESQKKSLSSPPEFSERTFH